MTENRKFSNPRHLRVFIASPGDVADERALAMRTIERLPYDPFLRGRITIELVSWDRPGSGAPMLGTLTPQEALNKRLPRPSECDIVIVILWSRMGTPLLEDWETKSDGSPYRSGTEWEYLDALSAAEKTGSPNILIYRREQRITVSPDDPDLEEKIEQWRAVDKFFKEFRNPDGSLKAAYNSYQEPSDFEQLLEHHLRELIRRLLEPRQLAGEPSGTTGSEPSEAERKRPKRKREVTIIRLLLSSPGDLHEERARAAAAVFRFNQIAVEDLGLFIKLVRWEDMAPQIGPKAQQVINKQIGSYDIFCGIMWNRFGTPTEIAASGL